MFEVSYIGIQEKPITPTGKYTFDGSNLFVLASIVKRSSSVNP